MKDFSFITSAHPSYVENLYQEFTRNPESVDPEFRKFFEGFDFAMTNAVKPAVNGAAAVAAPAKSENGQSSASVVKPESGQAPANLAKELGVYRLILGYRNKGHLIADTNPIRKRKDRGANLDLAFFALTEEDLDKSFYAGNLIGLGTTTLREILSHMQRCYAAHVGIEFKYISDQKKVDFLTREMEKNFLNPLSLDKKKRILEKLE